jgi:threonine synthase
MKYISTRGTAPVLGFAETTLAGLATDGGLYVPEACPKITSLDLGMIATESYLETAFRVMLPFVSEDMPSKDLIRIIRNAYSVFNHEDITPLHKLEDNFYIQELTHGPTLAFKDVALQFLGQVFDYLLDKNKQKVTIVGATSGDTGSAAIEAFKGKDSAHIVILHPHGRVSEVQRRQMTTVLAPNVSNIAIEGSFDDCQDIVKAMFNDLAFRNEMALSAVNSINWARILAQVVYYIYAAARVQAKTGKRIAFSVPTGNFGNVYAGYVAHSMGAPIDKFIVATNSNDILHRFFATGKMHAMGVAPTISPSMDIQISSNFERLLFDLYGRNGANVAKTMQHFRDTGPFELDTGMMDRVQGLFTSGRRDDAQTEDVIRRVYNKYGYIIDPHTAVGVGVAEYYQKKNPESVIVSLATAHPAKFPEAVKRAIGIHPELPPHMSDLFDREERCQVLQPMFKK